jgi:hypothetical protein
MQGLKRIDRIRFVILESPYDTWGHPMTESLFSKMVTLKLNGYGREYPYGVMAVDTTDMICDHLLICEETEDGLRPLVGNKSIPLSKCEQFHLPFPGLSLLEEAGAKDHVVSMQKLIAHTKAHGGDLRYAGGWTMDPNERGQGEWSKQLRELFTAIYISYYLSIPKVGVITGATMRFKIETYTKWLGHEPLHLDGKELDPINVVHLAGEKVLWTYMNRIGLEPRIVAKKWAKLWHDRLHIKVEADRVALKKGA